MRAIFLLLVAANLALFAWPRYYAIPEGAADPEPQHRQVNPASIRLLTEPELAGLPMLKPKPVVDAAQSALAEAAPSALAAAGSCLEWGGFSVLEAPRAEKALEPLALGAKLSQRGSEENTSWWVFIPPQGNRAGALKKTAELKSVGIDEYFILQDGGRMRWAISLGVFSREEAARNLLEAVRAKGIRGAQLGERDSRVAKIWFQVRNPDAAVQGTLKKLALGLPGTEVRDCPQ